MIKFPLKIQFYLDFQKSVPLFWALLRVALAKEVQDEARERTDSSKSFVQPFAFSAGFEGDEKSSFSLICEHGIEYHVVIKHVRIIIF